MVTIRVQKKYSGLYQSAALIPFGGVISGGAGAAWNALGTTGKVLVGAAGGYGIASLFGGGKKQEEKVDQAQQPIQAPEQKPQNIYNVGGAWQPQYDVKPTYQYDYSTITGSPYASIASKKGSEAQGATPSWSMPYTYALTPTQTAAQTTEQGQGMDWATIAAIAGVALVAYGYTSRRKP